jgi:hypothetical protein
VKRLLWKAWHGVVVALCTGMAFLCAIGLLPTLALMEYETRTDWDV